MLNLIKISLLKELWEIKNNKFKLILTIFFNIGILLFVYFKVVKNMTEETLGIQYLIVLSCIFYITMNAFSYTGNIIINESKLGTIENLIVSPYDLITIIITRLLINFIKTLIIIAIIFISLTYFSDISIQLNILTCIGVIFLGVFSLYGLGIIIASISLFSKEIQLLSSVVKIIVVYLILKMDSANILIPFSHAKILIENLLVNNGSINEFSIIFLCNFVLNSIIYFMLGLIIFNKIERLALKNGSFSIS